jgi:glutathione S-transferase
LRTLYHYEQSVFSRRTRLALAHKGIAVELKDGRLDAGFIAAARALQPIRTLPVLVEEDGQPLGDSNAIVQYLELAYPEKPALFPKEPTAAREALAIMAAVDVALNAIVDCGTRIYDLRNDPAWPAVKEERMGRAQDAIDFVASKVTRPILAGGAWSAADIWVYAATRWVSAFPGRVETSPQIAQIVTLGFRLPDALVAWSKPHDSRPDVRSIYG